MILLAKAAFTTSPAEDLFILWALAMCLLVIIATLTTIIYLIAKLIRHIKL